MISTEEYETLVKPTFISKTELQPLLPLKACGETIISEY